MYLEYKYSMHLPNVSSIPDKHFNATRVYPSCFLLTDFKQDNYFWFDLTIYIILAVIVTK